MLDVRLDVQIVVKRLKYLTTLCKIKKKHKKWNKIKKEQSTCEKMTLYKIFIVVKKEKQKSFWEGGCKRGGATTWWLGKCFAWAL